VAETNQHRTLGVTGETAFEGDETQLVGPAAGGSQQGHGRGGERKE
jgi:hypothetical protein